MSITFASICKNLDHSELVVAATPDKSLAELLGYASTPFTQESINRLFVCFQSICNQKI